MLKLSLKELKMILKWFDTSSENLGDFDLKIYDKIIEYVKEKEQLKQNDILVYRPIKKKKDDFVYDEDSDYQKYVVEDYNKEDE